MTDNDVQEIVSCLKEIRDGMRILICGNKNSPIETYYGYHSQGISQDVNSMVMQLSQISSNFSNLQSKLQSGMENAIIVVKEE